MIPITAIVTAFTRIDRTLGTLRTIEHCEPPPSEILVHIDGNQHACADAIRTAHPHVRVLVSEAIVGPGGARNAMIAAASNQIVASFDDDSYPIDADYFGRLASVIEQVRDASVVAAFVYHRHQSLQDDHYTAAWAADFSGGACAYRRDHFLETGGYVPLQTAYGMEEVDLALRLHARGRRILQTPWLRVFHDTDLTHHADPSVTAASVTNLALLAYLRYPLTMWLVGAGQCLNRVWWLLGHGRSRGVLRGLRDIPSMIRGHRRARHLVPASAVWSYLRLRRVVAPVELSPR